MVKKLQQFNSSATIYAGIDVGFSGAMSLINKDFLEVYSFPIITTTNSKGKKTKKLNINDLVILFNNTIQANTIVAIEKQSPRPRQGVVSVFSLGEQYGILEALLTNATGTEPHQVAPSRWKSYYPSMITPEMVILNMEARRASDSKEKSRLKYRKKKLGKERAIELANIILVQKFKNFTLFGKGEDGQAESFLIALWAMAKL